MNKALVLSFAAALALSAGCDVDSPNSVIRSVRINVAGVYSPPSGSDRIVSQNSGNTIRSLDLRQSGDQLEAVDNNGLIFRGTIGSVQDSSASFSLQGTTTDGRAGVISGTISVSGSQGTMQGTWIEDDRFGTVFAVSTGQSVITNTPDPGTNTNTTSISIGGMTDAASLAAYRQSVWWFSEG